jgi:phosphohistidine phosphatase
VPEAEVDARTLLVLRHAKAATPAGVGDRDRPLTDAGLERATEVGRSLPLQPDLVLCSPALRTQQTWEAVRDAASLDADVRLEPTVYEASLQDLLDLVVALPDDVHRVLLVGHNPGCTELVEHLSGEPTRMRTSSLAVLELSGSWVDGASAGGAALRG